MRFDQYVAPSEEFDIESEDLADLEIRDSGAPILFFMDRKRTKGRGLVKSFVIADKRLVAIMCTVTLVKKGETCSPRLRFWTKNKESAKPQKEAQIPNVTETRAIKAAVDTADGHENLWKLIQFLQTFRGLDTPTGGFSVVQDDSAKLIDLLRSKDKQQVLEALQATLGANLTEKDINLIADRKRELQTFERLLNDAQYFDAQEARGVEAVWQKFFERNQWIFGYGLNLIATNGGLNDGKLERMTTGASAFVGAGKEIDAVTRTRGFVSTLLFCEIKTHRTPLLVPVKPKADDQPSQFKQYRVPDVYSPSYELSGAVAQVQKTTRKALRDFRTQMVQYILADGTPTAEWFNVSRPRQVVVVGMLQQFSTVHGPNGEMIENFELYRTSISDTEIITYDELYARARFIVES